MLPHSCSTVNTTGSALSVRECDETDAFQWDQYVQSHPEATPYHQWGWRHIFGDAFRQAPRYYGAFVGADLQGILPLVDFRSLLFGHFFVSLPYVNYGGIIGSGAEARRALLDHVTALAAELSCTHIELRHVSPQFDDTAVRQHKVAMRLSLPETSDACWSALSGKVRNQVRKATKNGLSVRCGGQELLDDFYAVFAVNMRDLGTPVYGRFCFDAILRTFSDSSAVTVVYAAQRPLAGSVTIRFRDGIEVPWASSLRLHNHLHANELLYWEMIRSAIEGGLRVFDFGRSTPDAGTFHFKRKWGAQPTPLAWEYSAVRAHIPDHSPTNAKFTKAIWMWQQLPVSVANMLGPHIVRHIP